MTDVASGNSVAVVTGGAGGMGLATAKILGRDHYMVICDVNEQRLAAAMAELEKLGIRGESAVCDVTDRESVSALVKQACAAGKVGCVVHTAGISPQMGAPESILKINAIGTLYIAEAFYQVAGENFALVNVASMAAHVMPGVLMPLRAFKRALSDPDTFLKKLVFRTRLMPSDFIRKGLAYAISKRFVIWYSEVNAAKFGAKGARILSVSPGTFDTEMGRLEEKSGSMKMLEKAALKRPGRPEEIAAVLAFCASEKASYLTGVDILCDGGVVAGMKS